MGEKKRVGGWKLITLCFSSQKDEPETLEQDQQFQQYQQFQKNLHDPFPHHLKLHRPQPQVQIPHRSPTKAGSAPGSGRTSPSPLPLPLPSPSPSPSPVAYRVEIKLPSKESCQGVAQRSKCEPQYQKSPSVSYTPKDVREFRQNPGHNNCDIFTYEELKLGTMNFQPDLIIGEGGFGVVYRGEGVRPGYKYREVAIKQLDPNGFQGDKEWLTEVSYLGKLSHPNLVKLIGYCCEDEHRLLIYEYMTYGCLEKHLFRRTSCALTWTKRLKILLDAAKGLAYLHDLQQPIIYRDFKTSNILLDSNFNAKLSDFGLAKEGPTGDQTHVSTRVMGTYGYAAPEYIRTGHLTVKSDVYGFGVVVLEMLIGRRAFDTNERDLVEWCRPLLNTKKVLRILDTRIDGQYTETEMMGVASLAHQCLSQSPKVRPWMSQVVDILEVAYKQCDNGVEEGPSASPNYNNIHEEKAARRRRRERERRCKSESNNDSTTFKHEHMRTHSTSQTGC